MLFVLAKKVYHCVPSELEHEDYSVLQLHWNILQMEKKHIESVLKKSKNYEDKLLNILFLK